jgi:hypothetical protein
METTDAVVVPRCAAAQLALHAKLAAHHACAVGSEPAAAEAVLAWAVLVVCGGAEEVAAMDAMPTAAEIVESCAAVPAYRAAADQAEQLLTHFDYEEQFELATLYGQVVSVIEGEIERMSAHVSAS